MLINPLSRPLDLVGDKDVNYVQDESHEILETADRIFVPVHGPFYGKSLEVIDKVTMKKLVVGEDYKVLHILKEITKLSTKEVFAVIYITKKEVSKVSISYRVPGGKYTDLSDLYRELIKNYASYRKPVYWSEILGLPKLFSAVPHKHSIMDLVEIGELTTALDLVINAIYSNDFENWLKIYEYLDEKLKALKTYKSEIFTNIELRANALLTKASPFLKEFWFFNDTINPNADYNYGVWERRGDYLLYGQMHNEAAPLSTFNVPAVSGLQARQVALWQYMKHTTILTYKLAVNKTAVLEGGSVTFTLTTTGGVGGEVYKYVLSGVMYETGEVILNSSGVATLVVNVPTDINTNGLRKLTMTLVDHPYVSKEIDVIDVVTGPQYRIGFYSDQTGMNSIDTVNEGGTGYVVIKGEGVADGTVVNLIYNGDVTSDSLTIPLPATVTMYDNIAAIQISPRLDKISDGNKYMRVGMSLDNVVVPSAATMVYVRDTSKTPTAITYWASSPTSNVPVISMQEGSIAYLVIETTNIPAGTLAQTYWYGAISQDDFTTNLGVNYPISETGRTVIPLSIKADNLTEGVEICGVTIDIGTDFHMDASIYIEDVSRNDNIDVRFSTNSIGTNSLTTIKEGSSIYLVVKTEDIPDEGKLKLVWSGTTNANDFTTELPTFIDIKNNYGYLNLIIKADNSTEGDETLSVAVYDQAHTTLLATQSLTIVDSSTAPTYQVLFSGTEGKVTPINEATESDLIYGVIKTTQIPDNTVMFIETLIGDKLATYANGDVLIDVAKTAVIDAGYAYFPIHLRMDERKDGDKLITIRLRADSPDAEILTTNQLMVKDTSVIPTYNLQWSSTYDKVTAISAALAGQTIYAHVKTTSIAPGTALYLEYGQAGIGGTNLPTDFLQSHSSDILPRIVRIDGEGLAIVPIKISKTLVGNVALNLRLSLSRVASNATHVITSVIPVTQPTYVPSFASNPSGTTTITSVNEGQTIYAVLRTTNVPNNTVFDVHVRIGNEIALATNKDVSVDVATKLTVVNNIGTIPIVTVNDGIGEGTEQIDFHILYDHMSKDEEIIYFATQTINLLAS